MLPGVSVEAMTGGAKPTAQTCGALSLMTGHMDIDLFRGAVPQPQPGAVRSPDSPPLPLVTMLPAAAWRDTRPRAPTLRAACPR
jgi:hypothetical protein